MDEMDGLFYLVLLGFVAVMTIIICGVLGLPDDELIWYTYISVVITAFLEFFYAFYKDKMD